MISTTTDTRPRLSAQGLTVGYEQRIISENLNIHIPEGSFTVIVGPNACGKSTLLRALARLIRPRLGDVLLDGKSVAGLPAKELARRLGLLPQSSIAPDGITVADLVADSQSLGGQSGPGVGGADHDFLASLASSQTR